jgi:hypothetical protein
MHMRGSVLEERTWASSAMVMNESKCDGVRKKLVVIDGLEVVGWRAALI